jgi:hypothetical protein
VSVSGNANVGNIGATNGVFTTVAGALTTAAQPNITSVGTLASLSVTATITGSVSGTAATITTAAQPNITSVGTLTSLSVTGNINAGNVTATTFTGALTGLASSATVAASANSVAGANVSGTVSSATTAGTVTTAAQPNITSTGTLTSVSVSGNANVGNLGTAVLVATGTGSFGGNVNLNSFNIISLATPVNDTDAATKAYVDTVAQGLDTKASVVAATTVNITLTGAQTIDGISIVAGNRVLVKNQTAPAENGLYLCAAGSWTRTTDMDNWTEVPGAYVFVETGTTQADTGWVCTSNAGGTIGVTAMTWAQFSGAGSYTAGTGLTLTGSVFSVNVAQTQITSVGTLTSLSVSGNITAGNVSATTFTGALSGAATSATTAGTVTTAAQPNITSTGTLASLSVTGNANVGNIGAVAGVFTGNVTVGNIVSSGTGGNITGANVISANTFSASGNISAGNISATTFTGAFSGSATTAGTVTTAAQPNITSVGTLTSLAVTGNGTFGNINTSGTETATRFISNIATGTAPLTVTSTTRVANLNVDYANVADNINVAAGSGNNFLIFANAATGNVAELTSTGLTANLSNNSITATTFVGALSGAATSATTAGTVTTAAQGNITSLGTLSSLSVSGQITNANITTGANTTAGNLTGNWTLSAGSRLQATYADLAEKYVADATYAPGTVLIFGGDKEVTIANAFDSTRVAGVVTTNPAYVMNSACEGEHVVNIALQGRVPVKVQGPVYKGDLLVSSTNGHATANNIARAGTIIGKSLENFTGESGTVEVAVGRF